MNFKNIGNALIDFIVIIIGIFSAALGLDGFLIPNGFLDGGVTGISLFLSEITGWSISIFLILINIPFIIIGWKNLSKTVIFKSIATIIGLSLFLLLFHIPLVTDDKLLSAVFGGFFLGLGIGLVVRRASVLDGTEIMALLVSRISAFTMGDIILIFNIVLFIIVGAVLGLERAMYSILTYVVASKSIDFVIHGFEEFTAVTIISKQHEKIRKAIILDMGKAVTIFKGAGGMSEENQDILYLVVTRLEITRIKRLINEIDKNAFVVLHKIDDTSGGVIKKNSMLIK